MDTIKRCVLLLVMGVVGARGLAEAQATSSKSQEVPTWLHLVVPTKEAKLVHRSVRSRLPRHMPLDDREYVSTVASRSLPLLFEQARSGFPQGTKLMAYPRIEGKVMMVSLSRQFWEPGFWKSGEQTDAAIDSVVQTAIQDTLGNNFRVLLLREGKPMKHLAGVYVGQPLPRRFERLIEETG